MLHKAYIPEREQIIEVIGTVRYDDGLHFVFWDQNFCKYDDVHVGDCVPYDGEMLPQKGSVPKLMSLEIDGVEYDPSLCDDCDARAKCFPSMFQRPVEGSDTADAFAQFAQFAQDVPVVPRGVDPRGDGQFDGGPTGGFDGQ
jgi:hypothetical protein